MSAAVAERGLTMMKQNGTDDRGLAPVPVIYGAFALGLTTALAFRVIIILQHVAPAWVRPVWYFAVIGNLAFFYYRYRIAEKRKRAVEDHGLIAKVEADTCFSPDEREALAYLLRSIRRSPENINYLIISIFSVAAIAVDLALVLFSKT